MLDFPIFFSHSYLPGNRDTISKPDSLKYLPNLNQGFHARVIQSLCQESSLKNKKSAEKGKSENSASCCKRTKTNVTEKTNSVKKTKIDLQSEENKGFDSYTFSLALINAQDNSSGAEIAKDTQKKYVLSISNLPNDITKEQLEEHFRISRKLRVELLAFCNLFLINFKFCEE